MEGWAKTVGRVFLISCGAGSRSRGIKFTFPAYGTERSNYNEIASLN